MNAARYHLATCALPHSLPEIARAAAAVAGDRVWLDSAVGHEELGRRSLIALELQPAIAMSGDGVSVVNRHGELAFIPRPKAPFALADRAFGIVRAGREGSPLGWVGYVAYEAGELADDAIPSRLHTERDGGHPSSLPFPLVRFDQVVAAVIERDGESVLVAEGSTQDEAQRRAARWREGLSTPPTTAEPPSVSLLEEPDRVTYESWVRRVRTEIAEGRIYQACTTFPLWFSQPEDTLALYLALRDASPGDYGAWLRMGELEASSTSPERLLAIHGETATARPMKGTRARGAADDEDAIVGLAQSEKDRAENVMIVDLVRNDLGRVCRPGSVTVPSLFDVESYRTVHQMTSTIRGTLAEGVGPFSALAACFPPGSMTGAPKVEACKLLAELEPQPRGLYAGCIGWVGYDATASFSVVIRTLQCYGGFARWDVGGGIVADSDPAAEWDEALVKARPILSLCAEKSLR